MASHSRSFDAARLNGQKMTLGIDTAMLGGIGRVFVPRHEALFAAERESGAAASAGVAEEFAEGIEIHGN